MNMNAEVMRDLIRKSYKTLAALNAHANSFPVLSNGIHSDETKSTPEWKLFRSNWQDAFSMVQLYNATAKAHYPKLWEDGFFRR